MPTRWAFLDSPGPIAFAHRGGNDGVQENSMRAFERAVELGYRYIETDVHATRDGVLVAFHDTKLDALTDGIGAIADLTWAEVERARIGGVDPIPRLEDLLTAWPHLRLNIEPKSDAAVEPLTAALRAHDAIERVCVGSFDDQRIHALQSNLGPALCTSPGPRAFLRVLLRSYHLPISYRQFGCIQIPLRYRSVKLVTPRLIRRLHELDLQLHVWTVNDASLVQHLLDIGVDGIMTDEIAMMRSVFSERGVWHH